MGKKMMIIFETGRDEVDERSEYHAPHKYDSEEMQHAYEAGWKEHADMMESKAND